MREPLSLIQIQAKYGKIENGIWADETKYCGLVHIPDDISKGWINSATGLPTTHVYCNSDFGEVLFKCLSNVESRNLLSELKTFDGCFCIRDIRAVPGKPSMHSWGCAIDINASENQLGHPTSFSPEFIACFTDEGLTWGGRFKRTDPMHFSFGF